MNVAASMTMWTCCAATRAVHCIIPKLREIQMRLLIDRAPSVIRSKKKRAVVEISSGAERRWALRVYQHGLSLCSPVRRGRVCVQVVYPVHPLRFMAALPRSPSSVDKIVVIL